MSVLEVPWVAGASREERWLVGVFWGGGFDGFAALFAWGGV